jgi:DNA primase (bacterial type)
MLDNGKFKGWVCRTTSKKIEIKRKYLYSQGFSRATTLVGNYGKKDFVVITEGFMDRLKFLQFGYDNVVAILGWKMSIEQIKKLKNKGIKNIISALDNDVCGKKGTKFISEHFNVISFCYSDELKDAGDIKNKKQFKKMFNKTKKVYKKEKRKWQVY